jgi:hypothetical protein
VKQKTVKRVELAKKVASRWLEAAAKEEYRISVYSTASSSKNLPVMLRLFRDGRMKIGSVKPITDLGVKVAFDHLEIWSSNRDSMIQLDSWLRDRGYETSGIW